MEGGAPQQAAYNPNIQGGQGGGQSAMAQAQCRPLYWIANLDCKPICTPSEMMQWKADKKLLPGIEACKFLPHFPPESLPILGGFLKALIEACQGGGQMQDWAFDLSPEQVEQLMALRTSGIQPDEGNFKSQLGQLALKNVEMNNVGGPDGHGVA